MLVTFKNIAFFGQVGVLQVTMAYLMLHYTTFQPYGMMNGWLACKNLFLTFL
jgi:hypothetical protein